MMQNDKQFDVISKPRHYNNHPSGIECRYIRQELNSHLADSFKYVFRHRSKSEPTKDIMKAIQYLDFEIDLLLNDSMRKLCQPHKIEQVRQDILTIRKYEKNGHITEYYLQIAVILKGGDVDVIHHLLIAKSVLKDYIKRVLNASA